MNEILTKCCNAPLKADPKSNESWFVPRCSKCGSTRDILSYDDLVKLAKAQQ